MEPNQTPNSAPAADSSVAADTGAAAAPEYLSKSDFDSKWSQLEERLSRLTPTERREGRREEAKSDPTEPDPKAYKWDQPGELQRFQRDSYKFMRHQDKAEEAKAATEQKSQESIRNNEKSHNTRVSEYRKDHPEYDADMKAAGMIQVHDFTKDAIFSHKQSAAIVHYLAKTPAAVEDLRNSEDEREVMFKIGEIAASIRKDEKYDNAMANAAGVRPLRVSQRSAPSGGDNFKTKSKAEIFKEFNS